MSFSSDLKLVSDMASSLSAMAHSEGENPLISHRLHVGWLNLFRQIELIDEHLTGVQVEMPDSSYPRGEEEHASGYEVSELVLQPAEFLHIFSHVKSFDMKYFDYLVGVNHEE